jgi:hypothetical protein
MYVKIFWKWAADNTRLPEVRQLDVPFVLRDGYALSVFLEEKGSAEHEDEHIMAADPVDVLFLCFKVSETAFIKNGQGMKVKSYLIHNSPACAIDSLTVVHAADFVTPF